MGFIQTPVRKIMKRKLPNTQSLRKARADYREWLKERGLDKICLLYTSPSPRDGTSSRMPSSA